jgi:hypothetical protein
VVFLDALYQFQIDMARINQNGISTVIGTYQVGVGIFREREMEEYLHLNSA